MITVQFNLPDALAQRARSEGFLSDAAIQRLLEEAMRRRAGRRLIQVAERLHAANIEPMSEDEIDTEIQASRAQRQSRSPRNSQ
jgi:hypothetical protein